MPDYEKMYFELLNKTERIVRILTEYQREIADMYAEAILAEMEKEEAEGVPCENMEWTAEEETIINE